MLTLLNILDESPNLSHLCFRKLILGKNTHCLVKPPKSLSNVMGEPVFSVVATSWFCEKSSGIGKVEDVKPMLFI